MTPAEIVHYCEKYTTSLTKWEELVVRASDEELHYTDMLSSPVEISLMKQFIYLANAKNILEIGMFTGLMTVAMADAAGEDGRVTTTDLNPKYLATGRRALNQVPFSNRIDIIEGQAIRHIMTLHEQSFDIIFIDADKEMYPVYYDLLLPHLSDRGCLILDNMLWKGEVLETKDRKSKILHELNHQITLDQRVRNTLLPGYDGWQVVTRS